MTSGPITSWQIDGETVGTVSDFIFLGSKITADGDFSHEIKRRLLLGRKADLSELDFIGGLDLLGYLLVAVFGSLLLQVIFAKIFRIDSDMMVIASVTYINSPPFVPMMAAAMKNKDVLIPGLTIGVIGYAVGNYLGFLMSQLLGFL